MPDLALDLRYLKYAVLAAEQGSFRRVADALDLSQSTVSRRILLLERRLGVALFERRRTGVSLTPAGRRFIDDAAIGVERLRKAIYDLKQAQNGQSGELRIGLITSLASGFLGDLLATFHQKFPHIDVKLEEGTSQAVAAGILSGRLDVAFIPGEPQMSGSETTPLWDEPIYVALPEGHALAGRPALELGDLRNELYLVTAEAAGPDVESYLMRHLSTQGFQPNISVQRVGRENLLNMVAMGFGIALTTVSTLGVTYSGVLFRPVINTPEIVTSSVVCLRSNRNPAVAMLLDLAMKRRGATSSGQRINVGTTVRG
ncbi:LysR family transcriptional regulator [Agrobacterium vitis]|uniref:LysR family transcriptional regulator n=1 Tax=Agrobacterium vitis TaxID=373 RepID=UPI0012E8BE1F|nr:LysR family transcriptional regulator [Agrobacterium vitis]MUZ65636.1 LysR family transcriptional regulator [Agrobacterium vitis]